MTIEEAPDLRASRPGQIGLFETLQQELLATNNLHDAERARIIKEMFAIRGTDLIYNCNYPSRLKESTKVYPEISLTEEHKIQGLLHAGRFAARLGFNSHAAYIATLPRFPERPPIYDRLALRVPLIVETRIPWLEAAELSDIYVPDFIKESADDVQDWEGINFNMPKVPFTAWVQDGSKFVYRIPSDVRKELGTEENKQYVAGLILLAISMYNVRPDLVRAISWNIIGTKFGSGRMPFLYHWNDRPELSAIRVGLDDPNHRALVFGREIRTL